MQTTSKTSKPEITCIYVNYHSVTLLERSLESLAGFESDTLYEVIIVNNDQQEEAEIRRIGEKFSATVLPYTQNVGFGVAVNRGATQASGSILFFVNPDTQWTEAFFQYVVSTFQNIKNLGALGIELVSPSGKKEKETEWLSGGALFIPQKVFTELGGFDERFFMYFEDKDLCLRLQQAGYQIIRDNTHTLVHFRGRSHVSKKSQKRIYDQSLYKFTKKHWPWWKYGIFRILHPFYRFLFPYGRS